MDPDSRPSHNLTDKHPLSSFLTLEYALHSIIGSVGDGNDLFYVVWGIMNFAVALILRSAVPDLRFAATIPFAAFALGFVFAAVGLARYFPRRNKNRSIYFRSTCNFVPGSRVDVKFAATGTNFMTKKPSDLSRCQVIVFNSALTSDMSISASTLSISSTR